jgi:hypothetical protein
MSWVGWGGISRFSQVATWTGGALSALGLDAKLQNRLWEKVDFFFKNRKQQTNLHKNRLFSNDFPPHFVLVFFVFLGVSCQGEFETNMSKKRVTVSPVEQGRRQIPRRRNITYT